MVVFDDEIYDFADEYDADTGIFSPKEAGFYELSCLITWEAAGGTVAQWEAALMWEGDEIFFSGDTTDGSAATRQVHGTMKLGAGEKVQCRALQAGSASAQPLNVHWAYTTFEGHRFAK
jgi:hypothetical protein